MTKKYGRFFIGMDIGQQYDYTAITVIESEFVTGQGIQHTLQFIYRFPLKLPYPTMVDRVVNFVGSNALLKNSVLVVDYTGVGAPVFDMLGRKGLKPVAFSITGGNDPNIKHRYKVSVPKSDLVGSLQLAIQKRTLVIPKKLKNIDLLRDEINNYTMKIGRNSTTTYGTLRDSIHDDLVMSVSMALWYSEYTMLGKQRPFIITGR